MKTIQINFHTTKTLKAAIDEHIAANNIKQVDFFNALIVDFFDNNSEDKYLTTNLLHKKDRKIQLLEEKMTLLRKKHVTVINKINKLISKVIE